MPLTDDFDGIAPMPVTFTITPTVGTAVPLHGIENLMMPARSHKKDTYTPISGTRVGQEQVLLCSSKSGECSATLIYEKAHALAMDAICGTNGCAIVMVGPDDLTVTAVGGIEEWGIARMEDSRHMAVDVKIALNAGWLTTDEA